MLTWFPPFLSRTAETGILRGKRENLKNKKGKQQHSKPERGDWQRVLRAPFLSTPDVQPSSFKNDKPGKGKEGKPKGKGSGKMSSSRQCVEPVEGKEVYWNALESNFAMVGQGSGG